MTRINAGIPNQLTNNKNKVMTKKLKSYSVHIQFDAHRVTVKATTAAEAKKKAIDKLSKKKLSSLVDKNNCYVDED